MENQKKSTEKAKQYADRYIALGWASEDQRSMIEGIFDAGYVSKALENKKSISDSKEPTYNSKSKDNG